MRTLIEIESRALCVDLFRWQKSEESGEMVVSESTNESVLNYSVRLAWPMSRGRVPYLVAKLLLA